MSIPMDMPPIEGHEYTGEVRQVGQGDVYCDNTYRACTWQATEKSNGKYPILRALRWRAEKGERYYVIGTDGDIFRPTENHHAADTERHVVGNYFQTEEEAERFAVKIREILGARP